MTISHPENPFIDMLGPFGIPMAIPTRSPFVIRAHSAEGAWSSDDRRHFESATQLLIDLEANCQQVLRDWPVPAADTVRNAQADHPALWALVRQRDRLSDSVRIFAAMAIEGFLNYYGVVRLGEAEFNAHFERLGLIPKLRALLLVCDSISISAKDPLVVVLSQLADGRNSLVHPKAKEYPGSVPDEQRPGVEVPEAARQAVAGMNAFFQQFTLLVPAAKPLVPPCGATGGALSFKQA